MAYLKEIDRKCGVRNCASIAVFEVWPESPNIADLREPGRFCRKHATGELARASATERNLPKEAAAR